MSPATAPPPFIDRGGKPLLENPSSTVRKHSSHRVNPNDSERPLTSRCEWFSFRSANANDSYSRLTRALGDCVGMPKRFFYLGFQSMLINARVIRSPYVPYMLPLSIPYYNWIPCYGFPLLFFS